MTTQSSLQYSFTFTQSHIHTVHLLAALCCSMRHNSGFSILLKDTSACRFFGLGSNCRHSGWRTTTLHPQIIMKLGGRMRNRSGENPFNSGVDQDHRKGIFSHFESACVQVGATWFTLRGLLGLGVRSTDFVVFLFCFLLLLFWFVYIFYGRCSLLSCIGNLNCAFF